MDSPTKRRLAVAAAVIAAIAAAGWLVWRYTGLAEWVTVERVVELIEAASGTWWAALVVVGLYSPASLILFPRVLITLAAAVVFGPAKGFALAMTGVLLSAVLLQAAGKQVGDHTVRRIVGPRIDRLKRLLKRQGIMAVAFVGFLPVAPFSALMIVAGALRVPLRHLLPGVALSHLPGTFFTTVLGDQAVAALTDGREMNRMVVAGVVIAFVALTLVTHRWWRGVQAQEA